jgi:nicotinate-nucleotide pyrophosphorylase (carboxylating)
MPDQLLSDSQVQSDVRRALEEDVGGGDLTASLVPADQRATGTIVCRENAVLCGRPWVLEILRQVAPSAQATWHVEEGARVTPGTKVVEIAGLARELLTAERTCRNT